MTAVIQIKRSQTAAAQPASLAYGELGINITDKKIYIGNSSGATTLLVDGNATSTETIQDAAASLFTSGTHVGISVSYPDTNNAINLRNTGVLSFNSRTGSVSLTSSDVTNALGFTPISGVSTETIQDAAASLFTSGTHTGISVSYPDTNNSINLVNTGVLSFNTRTGTVSLTSGDVTTALGFTPTAYTAPTLGSTTLTSGATITSIAGLTSVTSTSFVGALTGNASTVTNGVYTTDTGTVTNTMLAGSIANNKLTNSSVTVNGSSISLGESATITATATNALTIGTGLSGSSYNGSTGVTIAINSTVATLTGNQTLTNKTLTSPTITSPIISDLYLSDGLIIVEGTTNDSNEMSLVVGMLTADRTITFPNATGTVITTGNLTSITSTGTIASGTWNGTAIGTVYGGTGLTSYTLGDLIYSSASNTLSKLSGNTTSTKKFLAQTGTGTVSAAPSWTTLTSTDVGLGNVENTALSTWAGSSNITTVGTLVGAFISGTLSVSNISLYSGTELFINNDGNVRTIIGDLGGNGNGTYIDIDDNSGKITLNAGTGIDNFANFNYQVTAPSFADTYSFVQTYRTTTTATTANQTIATVSGVYSVADGMNYPAFEVTVSAWDTVALKAEMLKMLVIQDGANTVNTQYGYIRTGATSIVSSYTTGLTGSSNKSLEIKATPLSTNSTNFTVTVRSLVSV